MYKGDTTTPGSLGYERKVLSSISNGTVTLSSWISLEHLRELLKSRQDNTTDVLQITRSTFDRLTQESRGNTAIAAELKKLLAETRIIIAPDAPEKKKTSTAFIREIEAAGVILGNTTQQDINDKTPMAKWLLDIMSQLTGNKDLDWSHLSSLLAAGSGADGLTNRINTLINHLLITMPAEAYDVDRAIRSRREVIWSV